MRKSVARTKLGKDDIEDILTNNVFNIITLHDIKSYIKEIKNLPPDVIIKNNVVKPGSLSELDPATDIRTCESLSYVTYDVKSN